MEITKDCDRLHLHFSASRITFADGMEHDERTYIAIDLKSFYASVECVERGLDPLTTHLVVADESRTDKTICLAVSPSLKAYGIGGRARLFEVVQRVRQVNRQRQWQAPGHRFAGQSSSALELAQRADLAVDYIVAMPRMARYIDYSARIYATYLELISPEDIHPYSIDEVFIDATPYLERYGLTAHDLARRLIGEVLARTGITATAGIGSNLYLCKVAMDIVAKHAQPDPDGVRIAQLDVPTYRRQLWNHRPLTDFWRVGRGTMDRLALHGLYTMGDVARQSIHGEELLFKLFGVQAELLIDHAWGYEPCTLAAIKAYRPESGSISNGQVLPEPYDVRRARIVVREMAEEVAMELLDRRELTDQLTLTIDYDVESLTRPEIRARYHGEVTTDRYGRRVPRHAHGSCRPAPAAGLVATGHVPAGNAATSHALPDTQTAQATFTSSAQHIAQAAFTSSAQHIGQAAFTSSAQRIEQAVAELYDRIVHPDLLIRRLTLCACHLTTEAALQAKRRSAPPVALDLFTDYDALQRERQAEEAALAKERRVQEAVLQIKKTYGKNAILKGLNFQDGATTIARNQTIGGHKA